MSKKITNGKIEVCFSKETGAVLSIHNKVKDIELVAEQRLGQSFRLLAPLPDRRNN